MYICLVCAIGAVLSVDTQDCSPVTQDGIRKHAYLTLTWRNYSGLSFRSDRNPEQAIYVLNGNEVGVGTQGFLEVIEQLRRSVGCRPCQTLFVFPDINAKKPPDVPNDRWTTVEGVVAKRPTPEWVAKYGKDTPDPVPFRSDARLMKAFTRLVVDRTIGVVFLPREPEYYEKWCPQALKGTTMDNTPPGYMQVYRRECAGYHLRHRGFIIRKVFRKHLASKRR